MEKLLFFEIMSYNKKMIVEKPVKSAFTLAEVLITLGIIGVVAAMTIPTLMNNVQDYQLKQAWKKNFSVLQQATTSLLQDVSSFKGAYTTWDHESFKNAYVNYLKTIKVCTGDPAGETTYGFCWSALGVTKALGGTAIGNISPLGQGGAGVILQDGSYVLFVYNDSTCTNQYYAGRGESLSNACGWITVDVNGAKGPNVMGKDTFGVWVLSDRIVPYGTAGNSGTCNTTSGDLSGLGCSAQYLNQ